MANYLCKKSFPLRLTH